MRTARLYGIGDIRVSDEPVPEPGPGQTQELRDLLNRMWETMHDEIAAESTRGVNYIVPGAGHFIQWDKPQVVVDAILKVLAETRQQAPTSGTGEGRH